MTWFWLEQYARYSNWLGIEARRYNHDVGYDSRQRVDDNGIIASHSMFWLMDDTL